MSELIKYGNYIDFSFTNQTPLSVVNDNKSFIYPYNIISDKFKNNIGKCKVSNSDKIVDYIKAVYFRGSAALDHFIPDVSDVDWYFVIDYKSKNHTDIYRLLSDFIKNNITSDFSDIKQDIIIIDYNNIKNFYKFKLKYFAKFVWGLDIRKDISYFNQHTILNISKNLNYSMGMHLPKFISFFIEKVKLYNLKDVTKNKEQKIHYQYMLKRILRQINLDYVFKKYHIYTHDLYYCHYFLIKFYSDYKDLFDRIINLILSNYDKLIYSEMIQTLKEIQNFISSQDSLNLYDIAMGEY